MAWARKEGLNVVWTRYEVSLIWRAQEREKGLLIWRDWAEVPLFFMRWLSVPGWESNVLCVFQSDTISGLFHHLSYLLVSEVRFNFNHDLGSI